MNIPVFKDIVASPIVQRLLEEHKFEMSNSSYSLWACRVRGLLGHCLRLQPAQKGSLALDYGTSIHAGLEKLMLGEDLDSATEAFIKTATELNIDKWLDDKRCINRGIETLAAWQMYKRNLIHDYQAIEMDINGENGRAVELSVHKQVGEFDTRIGYVCGYWSGRVDAVVKYKDRLWILDHKTSSMLGDKFLDDKLRSNQFLGYWFLLNDTIRKQFGENLAGVLLNVICTGRKEVAFETYEVPFAEWQIQEWFEETKINLGKIINYLVNITEIDNPRALQERELCVGKYGKCPFFDVCNTTENARKSIIEHGYVRRVVEPTNLEKTIEG